MSHLQTLVERTRPIDTGLKAATLLAVYDYGCIDTPSIVDLFAEINAYQTEDFNYEKKSAGVMSVLRQFDNCNLINLVDKGKATPGQAKYVVETTESEHLSQMLQTAYNSIHTCSSIDFPLHKFWQVRGGSFSTDEKQVVQGIHLSTFYGFNRERLENYNGDTVKAQPVLRQAFEESIGLSSRHASTYIKKFINMGLVDKSEPLGRNNILGGKPNSCAYFLTEKGKILMEDLFFPELAKTFDGHSIEPHPEPHRKDLTNIIQLHYEGFKNQFSH